MNLERNILLDLILTCYINWTAALIHHFIVLIFLPTRPSFFFKEDPVSKSPANGWSLKLWLLYSPCPQCWIIFFPSFSIRQRGGVWPWRRGSLRTNDDILFAQFSPNALIFCSLQPDYAPWFKPVLTLLYRSLPSDGSTAAPSKFKFSSWTGSSWTHLEL